MGLHIKKEVFFSKMEFVWKFKTKRGALIFCLIHFLHFVNVLKMQHWIVHFHISINPSALFFFFFLELFYNNNIKLCFQLFEQGLAQYTWKMKESADFIEQAMALVCVDVHQNLDIVQTNCHEIAEITISWSSGTLDVFMGRVQNQSYSMEELLDMQK